MKLRGSKPLTSAAIWQANREASKCVIFATPLFPATIFFQTSPDVLPTPQMRPRPVTTTLCANYFPPFACLSMYSIASLTVRIFSASSSGISMSKASSKAMTSSTVSRESAPKSSTKEALEVTSPSSTPSCSTMICLTFSSTAVGMGFKSPSYFLAPLMIHCSFTSLACFFGNEYRRNPGNIHQAMDNHRLQRNSPGHRQIRQSLRRKSLRFSANRLPLCDLPSVNGKLPSVIVGKIMCKGHVSKIPHNGINIDVISIIGSIDHVEPVLACPGMAPDSQGFCATTSASGEPSIGSWFALLNPALLHICASSVNV